MDEFVERVGSVRREASPRLRSVLDTLRSSETRLRARGISELWVFGSVARGDDRPDSDVDVACEFTDGERTSLLAISNAKLDIEEALGTRIDFGELSAMEPHVAESAAPDLTRVF